VLQRLNSAPADSENNLGGSSETICITSDLMFTRSQRLNVVQTRTEGTYFCDHVCAAESGSHGPRSSVVFLQPVKKPGSECSVRVSDDVC
jgi:hypothetical protein